MLWSLEETLSYKYLGFEIQLKPEQRNSIINLLRGEDAGYRVLPTGTEKFDYLSITHVYRQIKAFYVLF
jgi:hypothetical protein